MSKLLLLPGLLMIVCTSSLAQVHSAWRLDIKNSLNSANRAHAMVSNNADGYYILAGSWLPDSTHDLLVARIDTNGQQIWRRIYDDGAQLDEQPVGLAADRTGNLWVCASTRTKFGDADILVLKYASDGSLLASDRFGLITGNFDAPTRITVDRTGSAVVSGYVTSSDSGINFFVARYRSEGGLQWYRTYATMEMDIANDIVVDDSCNIYALGTINAAPHTSDIIVVKYDSSGRMAWNRLVDGDRSDNDAGIRIIRDDSSRCIVTGYMNRSGDRSDIPVILIDTKGEVVKQRLSYGGTSDCLVQNMSFYHDTLQLTAMYLDYATQRTGYQLIEFSGSLNPLFFRESDPGELNFGMITSGENRLMLSALVNEEEGTLRPFFRIPSTDSLPDYRWVDNEVNGIVYIRQVLVSENAVYYLCDDASEATGTLSIMRYDLDPEYRRPDQPRKSDVNRNKSFLPRR